MRILIVTHPPLRPEYGAAQMALNLAAALQERGHEAVVRSTDPLPRQARWWSSWRWQRRRVEELLRSLPRFDVIDLPPVSLSRQVARAAPTVARSVQPEMRYFWCSLAGELARFPRLSPGFPARVLHSLVLSLALYRAWKRAGIVLCLGSHEERWIGEHFASTRDRLAHYPSAPSQADQERLAEIRRRRPQPRTVVRFLWIGRWTAHKGIRRLLEFVRERAAADPVASFTIAGCGEAARRNCPSALLASGRLRLLPEFGRESLGELLLDHDAGLFTSQAEGWGLSLSEMLESGLPVFATNEGGVSDLRPFFPRSLHPFPPPPGWKAAGTMEDLEAGGYYATFSWPAIARRYEELLADRLALS